MFSKLINEIKQNKKLMWAVISIPVLVLIAGQSIYTEFFAEQDVAVVKKVSANSKKGSLKNKTKNKTIAQKAKTKGKNVKKVVSFKEKYAKMSEKDLIKEKEKLLKEKQKIEEGNKKFIEQNKNKFWLYSSHGDPIIALPTMIEKIAKELDLKIASLNGIRRARGGKGYDTVEVTVSCIKDMDTVIKFLNKLENGNPKVYWSKSSIKPYRSTNSTISFNGTANIMLLTDNDIGKMIQGDKWKTPPADVKSVGSSSPPSRNKGKNTAAKTTTLPNKNNHNGMIKHRLNNANNNSKNSSKATKNRHGGKRRNRQ
ncbi:hypothetical protein AAEX28_00345 [Lentisphaerota bacterium WC36G]|nr:hypothetical protein LJT99_03225 [Lentisphaerae bacterium WC36]